MSIRTDGLQLLGIMATASKLMSEMGEALKVNEERQIALKEQINTQVNEEMKAGNNYTPESAVLIMFKLDYHGVNEMQYAWFVLGTMLTASNLITL